MVLHHPIQIDQFAVDVIDDFDARRHWTQEVERRAAAEQFYIAFVLWKERDEAVGRRRLPPSQGMIGAVVILHSMRDSLAPP